MAADERALASILNRLLAGFADVGSPIRSPVTIQVRRDLPPAATTFRRGDGFVILVSDRAIATSGVAMLLAHELGHVQRMDAAHPSHDDDAITAAYASVDGALPEPYQSGILHHAINYTQDLYADPISFRVARSLGLVEPRELDALIAGFVNDEPYEIDDPRERRWDQTEDMVGNERAIALARLADAPRAREEAERAQERYLAKIPSDIAAEAPWFRGVFSDLPEETTREAFTRMLVAYVGRFVETAEASRNG